MPQLGGGIALALDQLGDRHQVDTARSSDSAPPGFHAPSRAGSSPLGPTCIADGQGALTPTRNRGRRRRSECRSPWRRALAGRSGCCSSSTARLESPDGCARPAPARRRCAACRRPGRDLIAHDGHSRGWWRRACPRRRTTPAAPRACSGLAQSVGGRPLAEQIEQAVGEIAVAGRNERSGQMVTASSNANSGRIASRQASWSS